MTLVATTLRCALALIITATGSAAACAQDRAIAIADVTVIPMDHKRAVPGQTVIIRGDRIEQIGAAASVRVPDGALRVDGRGKFLMPGIAEMHGHIPGVNAPTQLVNVRKYRAEAGC